VQPSSAYDQTTGDGHVWLFRDGPTQEVLAWVQVDETVEEVILP